MKNKPVGSPAKHIPQRTCIACRKVDVKRELVRLVCGQDRTVEIDSTGKKAGRGAYLCPTLHCWEVAVNTGKLETALRTSLNAQSKEILVNYAKGLNNTGSKTRRS